ncbi:MAG: hypothetical protein AAAFM81_14885 [Pseudomonadota bacterium]
MQDDLLKPTLSATRQHKPLYSTGALIAAAFFGGSFAVLCVAAVNSVRQQRLAKDIIIWLAAGVAVGVVSYLYANGAIVPIEDIVHRDYRLANRVGGFLLTGLAFLMHREAYRVQQFAGGDSPSPYVLVIVSCIIGALISGLLFASPDFLSGSVSA